MRKGAECLPELIHFFSACNEEQARFDSLALILATGETTPEIEDLKARILAETQFSIHEKMLLEYENLAKNPDDLALQEKIVTYLGNNGEHGWATFPFDLFGLDSLFVFEAISKRIQDFDSDNVYAFGSSLKKHFNPHADDILLSSLQNAHKTALALNEGEALELVDKLLSLIESLDTKTRVEYLSILLDEQDYPLNFENGILLNLVTACLAGFDLYPDQEIIEKLSKFFFNSHTAPQGPSESDTSFDLRRTRLLQFWNAMNQIERFGKSGDRTLVRFLEPNMEAIFSSDLAEFTFAMTVLVSKLEQSSELVLKLMKTNKPKMVSSAFAILRAMPSGHWEEMDTKTQEILELVSNYSMYSFSSKPIPESIRIDAAVTMQRMKPSLNSGMDSLLSGLAQSQADLRLQVLERLEETKITDMRVVDHLVGLLRKDPDTQVKLAAVRLIENQLDTASQAGEEHIFYQSSNFGFAILNTWNFGNEEFLEISESILERYVQKSIYAGLVLKAGLNANAPKINEVSSRMLSHHVANKLNHSNIAMALLSAQQDGQEWNSELASEIRAHSARVVQLVSNLKSDTQINEQRKIYEIADVLVNHNFLIKELDRMATSSESEENKQIAREILDRLNETKNSDNSNLLD